MQMMVLGMHRSGTSALTRIMNLMGAYFGPEHLHLGANQHNLKGYWERTDVIQINEQILALSDSRWYRPASTNLSALPLPASVNTAIQRVILGLDAHRPWVIKDPRMCLTAPFWLAAMEYPLVLICSRDAHAVAASLHARDNMPPEYAIALWEHYAVSLLKASYAQAKIHLRYEELIEQPTAVIEQIGAQLQAFGVDRLHTPSAAELHAYLQPAAVKPRKHAFPALTQEQLIIQSMLQGDTPIDINVEVSPASRELMARVIQGPPIG